MGLEASGKPWARTKQLAKIVFAVTFTLVGASSLLRAEQPPRAEILTGIRHAVSRPLREISPQHPLPSQAAIPVRHPMSSSRSVAKDPVVQSSTSSATSSNTSAGMNFDGISTDGYIPPDTNLSVGPTQIVQVVNVTYAVYDKETTTQLASGAIHTIFAALGSPCGTSDGGDPVVVYDKMANRWLISQLEYNRNFRSNYECVAVSTSADATGSYNLYQIPFGQGFPDYPKFGVWPDAYYFSANIFQNGSSFIGAKACAFSRSAMLAGNPVSGVCFQLPSSVASLLPSDLDGSAQPPAGEPDFFLTFVSNGLNLYRFHADFNTPSNSTFTGPFSVGNVAPFSPACGGGTCIPQPGTSQRLDSLADRLMFRLAYRNFGTYESLVVSQSVRVGSSSNQTGVRWYEIQDPNGSPSVNQQSTYAPDTTTYRWLSSIAQDQNGDIAVGYSVSNPNSVYPGIRIAGRLAGDPPNTLEAETTVVNGTASQTGSYSNRWGDYSSMSIDPSDDCTFWYTNEYLASGGSFNWNTRIASFKFSGCGSGTAALAPAAPTGLNATAGDAQVNLTWTASSGATSYSVYRSTTDGGPYSTQVATGVSTTSYTDTNLTNGTTYYYVVHALASGHESGDSNQASATPTAPTAPAAPTGLNATAGDAQVSLTWTASTGATSYNVYRSTASGGPYSGIISGLTTTSYTDTTVTNGTTYYYVVTAIESNLESKNSNEAYATPTAPTAPAAPTGLNATAGDAQVNLTWAASTGATSYNVYRSTASGGPYSGIISGLTTTSYTDTTVTNGTTYYYVVHALASGLESGDSNQASATPTAPTTPAAPTGLSASSGPGAKKISLSWNGSSGATSYNVKRSAANGGPYTTVASGVTSTNYIDKGLQNRTTYYYVVSALNSGGESKDSNQASARTR